MFDVCVKIGIQSVSEKRPFVVLETLNRNLVISFSNTVQYCMRVRTGYFYRFTELLAFMHSYYFPVCRKKYSSQLYFNNILSN